MKKIRKKYEKNANVRHATMRSARPARRPSVARIAGELASFGSAGAVANDPLLGPRTGRSRNIVNNTVLHNQRNQILEIIVLLGTQRCQILENIVVSHT